MWHLSITPSMITFIAFALWIAWHWIKIISFKYMMTYSNMIHYILCWSWWVAFFIEPGLNHLMLYCCWWGIINMFSSQISFGEIRFLWLILSTMSCIGCPLTYIWEWKIFFLLLNLNWKTGQCSYLLWLYSADNPWYVCLCHVLLQLDLILLFVM